MPAQVVELNFMGLQALTPEPPSRDNQSLAVFVIL